MHLHLVHTRCTLESAFQLSMMVGVLTLLSDQATLWAARSDSSKYSKFSLKRVDRPINDSRESFGSSMCLLGDE